MTLHNALQPSTGNNLPSLVSLPSIISNCSVLTIDEAIKSDLPSLKRLEAKYGRESISALVATCLIDICYGLAFEVNEKMLKVTADMVVERWYDLKLSDLKLFKTMYLTGEIGAKPSKTFRIDSKVFLEAFDDYYKKRAEEYAVIAEERNRNPKDEYDTSKCIPMPDYVKETYQRIERNKAAKMLNVEAPAKPIKRMTLDEIADLECIDKVRLAEAIRSRAEARQKSEKLPIELILQSEMAAVLFAARQNPKYLHELVKPIHD